MSMTSLILASSLLIIPIIVSYKQQLDLTKDMIISVLRAIIQLLIVGYILTFVFEAKQPLIILMLVFIILINAALNTRKRVPNVVNHGFWISLFALVISTSITMTILILTGALQFKVNEIIPVSGMVISNAMVAINIGYTNLEKAFTQQRMEIEAKLSLGALPHLASKTQIQDTMKMAVIPTIDSAKTLGIVALPGMMSGLIIAGTPPLQAIRFQIMVTFMLLSATMIATMIAIFISYKQFYNKRHQLKI
ncbi:iron export ABC transporter permease subunit FetB [Terrilactibacillus sp. BCM23-1]|uniref:Iron export ABC transporter permease subunit FetB n=1 Tax=Terrilactibacillus tamarindi TaxID=2599694 RepID=A0A6N8CRE3_9BACI|nr:iron export ABC transporter permease subunit FetB [Terrilactibacillus tamarindi]MTT31505.1 iron export ABC transporter permease subunit FetB [Terrilactibacillus tamarindi]